MRLIHMSKLLVTVLAAGLLTPLASQAADWYAVTVRGNCKSINSSDRIGQRPLNQNTIIQEYRDSLEEPPAAANLKLGYDPESDTIAIVDITTGESVQDVYAFGSSTVVANSLETQRLRHAFMFLGDETVAAGTAVITERITRDGENVITRLSVRGTFNYATPAAEETPAEICSGSFNVGKKLKLNLPEPPPAP
jgi:hypothetical protein